MEVVVEKELYVRSNKMRRILNENKKKNAKLNDDALLQSIGEGLIVTNRNGVVIKSNKAVKKILGFKEASLLGKKYWEIILEVDDRNNLIPKDKNLITRVLNNRRMFSGTSFYLSSKRRKIPVYLTISPVIIKGKLTGIITAFRDISEERAVDKAKSEFVSLTSHQLRTPLTTIKWYVQMLLSGDAGEINSEQRDYLNEVLLGADEMLSLLTAFLNVSRIELGTFAVVPEEVSVEEVSESVIKELTPDLLKKKINLKKNYSTKLPTLKADRKLLRIIFQNLITNAIKYTPESGDIELKLNIVQKKFVIIVKDTGYGIPEGEQSQIFKKMFRASNAFVNNTEGSGLGLYLIKSILDSVNGKIRFTSKEGWGTEFTVTLPLSGMKSKKGTKK